MKIDAKIQFEYKEAKDAKISYQSLEVENEGYIDSDINENILDYSLSSDSLSTFLATVDDLIFSEILVEKVLNSASVAKH